MWVCLEWMQLIQSTTRQAQVQAPDSSKDKSAQAALARVANLDLFTRKVMVLEISSFT